ncbi:MAG: glycosyltransferase [Actinobacteria bacterium]|uniref:Unannotated protein n=1 Tax=freshwater metagenome TaxID=449393 RepID=A0A6J5Z9K8_9ZZZZ|nr:glycosyltransferase [Actinomycetota bacterium]
MKVVAFVPMYLPMMGGIEILTSSLAEPLRNKDIELVIATDSLTKLPHFETINEVDVHRFDFIHALNSGNAHYPLKVLSELSAMLNQLAPDVIHVHSSAAPHTWFVDRWLANHPEKPLLITQHGCLEAQEQLSSVKNIAQRAQHITAVSNAVASSFCEFVGELPVTVIPNGVKIPTVEPTDEGRTSPELRIIGIGRLKHQKGFALAIQALAQLKSLGIDCSLTLVGGGAELPAMQQLATELDVAVAFAGILDQQDTHRLLSRSSILVVPSRSREGFSLVAAEAAFLGIPSVVSDVGGLPETVIHNQTGLVFPAQEVSQLSQHLAALARDRDLLTRLGAGAQERARAAFNLQECADQYASIYERITHHI